MIAVNHLQFSYQKQPVLVDLHFAIRSGEVVGLLGPNGAGKSTSIKLLLGLLAPTSGTVRIDGLDPLQSPRQVKSRIGIVHQNRHLDQELSVVDNLDIAGVLHGLPPALRQQRSETLIEEFGLQAIRHRPVSDLSGGEQRRTQLARAFLHQPRFLILDEPTTNLDSYWRLQVQSAIRQRALAEGLTVLWTSHDMREMEACATRILLLQAGKIIADDLPQRFARHLMGEYLWLQLPDAMPDISPLAGVIGWQREADGWWVVHVDSAEERLAPVMAHLLNSGLRVGGVRTEVATLERAMLHLQGGNLDA